MDYFLSIFSRFL